MLELHKNIENNYLLITVEGEADASSSIHLDDNIKESIGENHKIILVDCTNLNYISSAGLGVFMSHIGEIEEKEINFILFGLSEKVQNVFNMLGLDQLLTIKSNKAEVLAEI